MSLRKNALTKTFGILMAAGWMAASSNALAQTAPQFDLPSASGHVKLDQFRGQVVLVDFWASWCGPCRESFPWMNQMVQKYGQQGLKIIAINLDSENDDAVDFLQKNPADFNVAFDPSATTPEAWGVIGMPSSFVVDRNGNISASHVGFHTDQAAEYEAHLRQALKAN